MTRSLVAVLGLALAASLLLGAFALPERAPGAGGGGATSNLEREMQRIMRERPEIVLEAMRTLEERERGDKSSAQRGAIKANRAALTEHPATPVMGNPAGNVAVVEFFDYQCPYCKRVLPALMDTVKNDGQIRLVMKELPILGPVSVFAAKAALAAHLQGKYAAFHLALMSATVQLSEGSVLAIAASVGLDRERLTRDMEGNGVQEEIARVRALARDLAIEGTPAFVVGERLIPGAVDAATLREVVIEARK